MRAPHAPPFGETLTRWLVVGSIAFTIIGWARILVMVAWHAVER